ncbi:MAG: hypothetical protein PHW11_05065 [Anaerolineaceae bacterium]|nr:hypothetical protein [Anaerolineaceae bacterium]MDD4042017.1 hypothetical protein [Anaerolineaceae bacterium]MDD4577565.1 hypothetical protein [Anaerolineaceae bacterium]
MSDIYNIVSGDQDPFKKLLAKIPGFKGYVERGDRRMSDKILRETVAKEYETQYQRISSLQRDLISNGGLAYIDDLENAAIKIRQFIDRIKTASYGYAGIFDAIKIREEELANIYQYDLTLLEHADVIGSAIDNVSASIGTEGLPASIRHLIGVSQEAVDAFNKRSDALKGIAL